MSRLRIAFVFIIASIGLAALFGLIGVSGGPSAVHAQAGSGIIRVAATGADAAGCGSIATPCLTIQYAIDLAQPGDEVHVALGTYTDINIHGGAPQVVYISKTLALRGGYSQDFSARDPLLNPTTLDPEGWGRALVISGTNDVTVESFIISGGRATDLGGDPFGDAGGGVYIFQATTTLADNLITDNQATAEVWNDGLGGGVYAGSSIVTLRHNRILANRAAVGGFFASGSGGGVYLVESQGLLEANQIMSNIAGGDFGVGGGIELAACPDFRLVNNVIAKNQASSYGGSGVYIGSMSGVPSSGDLLHSTFASNSGAAGVRVASSGSVVTLTNTILVDHATGIDVSFGSTATLTATLWGSGAWANDQDWGDVGDIFTGTINIWGDPVFVDPDNGDYHISASSAAADQGVAAGVTHDLDGSLRDGDPDLGAYEAGVVGAIRVAKTSSVDLVNPGALITYTIRVTNSGATLLSSVTISDLAPSEQQILAAVPDRGNCAVPPPPNFGGLVTCNLGNLTVGEAALVTITTQVMGYAPPTLPLTMSNNVAAFSDPLWNTDQSDVILQNCHARVDGLPPTYDSVQKAVDAAAPGDAVWIAGTCAGVSSRAGSAQQVYVNKNMVLRGGYSLDFATWAPATNPTTLDATGQGRVLTVDGPADVTVEALRLTGGDATGLGGMEQDFADAGGSVYAINATLTLSGCQIAANLATANYDGFGGGIAVTTATLTLLDTAVTDNLATQGDFTSGYGGGLFAQFSDLHLTRSHFVGNAASQGLLGEGGGSDIFSSTLTAEATLWLSNTVSGSGVGLGGGLSINDRQPFTLTNCVFAGNQADGNVGANGSALLVEDGRGALIHPTIARNQGSDGVGLSFTSTVAITNAIIISHTVGIWAEPGSAASVDGVLWHQNSENVTGTIQVSHAITADPAFALDGYHLSDGSPAVNNGVASSAASDLDGQPRPMAALYDLGADERPACPEDLNGDGQITAADLIPVAQGWGGTAAWLDLNADGQVDIVDILRVAARWGEACP